MKRDPRYNTVAARGSAEKRKGERADCTVRALQNWLGIDYDEAWDILFEAGRRDGRGFSVPQLMFHLEKEYGIEAKGNHPRPVIKTRVRRCHCQVWGDPYLSEEQVALHATLAQFIRDNPTGNYYVANHNHAFVIKDGKVYDSNQTSMRTRIHIAYRLVSEM